jgi:hypothetical protein
VTLEPNLRVERGTWSQRIATQRALINQNLQVHFFEIDVNPIEVAS